MGYLSIDIRHVFGRVSTHTSSILCSSLVLNVLQQPRHSHVRTRNTDHIS